MTGPLVTVSLVEQPPRAVAVQPYGRRHVLVRIGDVSLLLTPAQSRRLLGELARQIHGTTALEAAGVTR